MPATELQKKAISFVIITGIAVLLLTTLPAVESWLRLSVLTEFGMTFQQGWELTPESAREMMNATFANAFDMFFRIAKIILWLTVVISVVRIIAFLILRAAYRNSTFSGVQFQGRFSGITSALERGSQNVDHASMSLRRFSKWSPRR